MRIDGEIWCSLDIIFDWESMGIVRGRGREWRFDNTFLFSSLPVHHRHASVASITHLSLSLSNQTKSPPPPLFPSKRENMLPLLSLGNAQTT